MGLRHVVAPIGLLLCGFALSSCTEEEELRIIRQNGSNTDTEEPLDTLCARPANGCACTTVDKALDCYLPSEQTENGIECRAGKRYCRELPVDLRNSNPNNPPKAKSVWGKCESIHTYTLRGAALISQNQCNPCDPSCALAIDRPVQADLTPSNASDIYYDSSPGGVEILPNIATIVLVDGDGDGVPCELGAGGSCGGVVADDCSGNGPWTNH